jgi:hypothetical protein
MSQDQSWYLNPVHIRKFKNTHWSDKQRSQILKLHRTHSTKEIAAHFSSVFSTPISVIQIDNQLRIARSQSKGLCPYCYKPHSGPNLACPSCVSIKSRKRDAKKKEALKKGLCGVCLKRKVIPGLKACKLCLSYVKRTRLLHSLCTDCGSHPINKQLSIVLCTSCYNLKRSHKK